VSARRDDSFQSALDEAWRNQRARHEAESGLVQQPRVRAVAFGASSGSGGKARFGVALDWTDEPTERPAPAVRSSAREAARRSGDTAAEIGAELGLGGPLTLAELASRWREFVWRNHPDRQPIEARAQANARVAIANALYEQARRKLARAG
jgi:hypothetical protein